MSNRLKLKRALEQARAAYDPDNPALFAAAIRAARDCLDDSELLLVVLAAHGTADGKLVYLGAVPADGDALARVIEEAARQAAAEGSPAVVVNFFSGDGGASGWYLEAVADSRN